MEVLNTPEAARYVRLSKPTLERFRISGDGPKFLKLGGAVPLSQRLIWMHGPKAV